MTQISQGYAEALVAEDDVFDGIFRYSRYAAGGALKLQRGPCAPTMLSWGTFSKQVSLA